APRKPPPPPIAAPRKPPPPPIAAPRKPPPPPIAAPPAKPPPRPPPNPRCADAMSGTSIATAAVAINAITVLRNMTVLRDPVAPGQLTLSWQKRCRSAAGIQRVATRSRTNLSHCDHQPHRVLFTLRSIVLFFSSMAA